MVERLHRGVGALIWRLLVVAIVALAIYVSLSRAALELLSGARDPIVELIEQQLQMPFTMDGLDGELVGFTPHNIAMIQCQVERDRDRRSW